MIKISFTLERIFKNQKIEDFMKITKTPKPVSLSFVQNKIIVVWFKNILYKITKEKFDTDEIETEILQRQTDGEIVKAIVRKTTRVIEQGLSWKVYRRDNYKYCGKEGIPMTVDHIIVWEEGGPSIEENLVTACRRCNKTRGSTPYGATFYSE